MFQEDLSHSQLLSNSNVKVYYIYSKGVFTVFAAFL